MDRVFKQTRHDAFSGDGDNYSERLTSMLSYAQNFEDVLLMRALQEVKLGHYIDIGAYHPVRDSVSLAFYQRGWRGTHVEPNPKFAALLREARPDETVIEAACSTSVAPVNFSVVSDTGLSTGVSSIASKHGSVGFPVVQIEVPTVTLSSILQLWENRVLHWLKIDVEGMEEDALRSWGECNVRPWICVIESTEPNSPIQNHHNWEHHLIFRNYIFAYFDGLNRYYVHEDKKELIGRFGPGPNVFDQFSISEFSPFAGHLLELRNAETAKASDFEKKFCENEERINAVQSETEKLRNILQESLANCSAGDIKIAELTRALEASQQDLLSERKQLEIEVQKNSALVGSLNDMNDKVATEFNERRKVELLLRSTIKANNSLQVKLEQAKRHIEQMEATHLWRLSLIIARFTKTITGMISKLLPGDKQRLSKPTNFLEYKAKETSVEGIQGPTANFPSSKLLADQSLKRNTRIIRKSILGEIDKLNKARRRQ